MKISWDQWKEFIGHLEVLKTYYARLTDRERYIVLAIAAGVAIMVLFGVYSFFAASTLKMSSKIVKSRENIKKIKTLQFEYSETERQVFDLEQIIRRTNPDFQLATKLEDLARKYGVSIDSLKPGRGMPNDLYRESLVTITVKQINLKVLISFLFDIENSEQLMRITSLKIKPNFQDPTQLNLTFVVSTFQLNPNT